MPKHLGDGGSERERAEGQISNLGVGLYRIHSAYPENPESGVYRLGIGTAKEAPPTRRPDCQLLNLKVSALGSIDAASLV